MTDKSKDVIGNPTMKHLLYQGGANDIFFTHKTLRKLRNFRKVRRKYFCKVLTLQKFKKLNNLNFLIFLIFLNLFHLHLNKGLPLSGGSKWQDYKIPNYEAPRVLKLFTLVENKHQRIINQISFFSLSSHTINKKR